MYSFLTQSCAWVFDGIDDEVRSGGDVVSFHPAPTSILPLMARHLTPVEIDFLRQKAALGKTPLQVHKLLAARRKRAGIPVPDLTNVRLALKGKTYRRGLKDCSASHSVRLVTLSQAL